MVTFCKVDGRVDVSATVFGGRITVSGVIKTFVGDTFKILFQVKLFGRGLVNRRLIKCVRQVNNSCV